MKRPSFQSGFTLVELIVVILLVGILSAYAASRYIGVSSFSATAAQEQAISVIRQVQIRRMYSNVDDPDNDSYKLEISTNCLGSVSSCSLSSGESVSDRLVVDDDITISSSYSELSFSLLGNPNELVNNDIDYAEISISASNDSAKVCINQQGYIYACN